MKGEEQAIGGVFNSKLNIIQIIGIKIIEFSESTAFKNENNSYWFRTKWYRFESSGLGLN